MNTKFNIDFDILDTKSPYYMTILDQSSWELLVNRTSYIRVIKPGYSEYIQLLFVKNQLNTLNSFNLGYNCLDECGEGEYETLPDGIYEMQLILDCGDKFTTKKFLRTTLLEIELAKFLISKIGTSEVQKQVDKIQFIIKSAKAHLMYDNEKEASLLFDLACKMLEKVKNC